MYSQYLTVWLDHLPRARIKIICTYLRHNQVNTWLWFVCFIKRTYISYTYIECVRLGIAWMIDMCRYCGSAFFTLPQWMAARLGSQDKVRCSVTTSWEIGKLLLQLIFYLKLLFQNTWSYIKWWLHILWYPQIDHSHVLLIVMQELGCFELVYVKFSIKSQSHETGVLGKLHDQNIINWQH